MIKWLRHGDFADFWYKLSYKNYLVIVNLTQISSYKPWAYTTS